MENKTIELNDATVLKQPVENDKSIVVNQIIVRNIDRTMKDIATWRTSHIAAERVVWPIRQRLYDTYSDVILDGHLSGVIEKRFSAVLNKELYFKDKEGKEIDAMNELINSKRFNDLRRLILDTINWGTGGAEFPPGKEFDYVEIPRKHIKPEYKIIAIEQYGFEGIDYTTIKNVMIFGETHDLGILLKCCPYALWKRGGFADYAQFVEIFGQPVRKFTYDAYDPKTKNEIQNIANQSAGAMSIIIPKQAEFDILDGKTSNANGDLQVQFIKSLNDEMSVIVLGNTETTTSSKGSGYAQSKEHGKQQLEITKGDLKYELAYLNSQQFKDILKSFGFPADQGSFCHEQEADVTNLSQRILIDSQVAKIVPISDDYFYETYDIPKPSNYDELKAKMEADKQAMLNPKEPDGDELNPAPGKPSKKGDPAKEKQDPEDLKAELKTIAKWRMRLADFFDQAPQGLIEQLQGLSDTYPGIKHQLDHLYDHCCTLPNLVDDPPDELMTLIDKMLKRIYKNKAMPTFIDAEIVKWFGSYYFNAVEKGFGTSLLTIDWKTPDYAVLKHLEENVYQFAAAKNYQEMKVVTRALVGDDGKLRSFSEFKQASFDILNEQVTNYMEAEYNLAVAGGQMSATWQRIQDTKETLPLLQYMTMEDDRVRPEHAELDRVIRPVDDPFWDIYYPPNGWNCRCDVLQLADGEVTPTEDIVYPDKMPTLFKTNLAKNGLIYPKDHPYFTDMPEKFKEQAEKLLRKNGE